MSKSETPDFSEMNLAETYLLAKWHPVYRWRDSCSGSSVELQEPYCCMLTERHKDRNPRLKIGMATDGAELLVVAKKVCNETGAKG